MFFSFTDKPKIETNKEHGQMMFTILVGFEQAWNGFHRREERKTLM
jgi:hypothetical protein